MTRVTYEVVEHDGGWAYKVGNVYSEPFSSHDEARQAAGRAAHEQSSFPVKRRASRMRIGMAAGTMNSRKVRTALKPMLRADRPLSN